MYLQYVVCIFRTEAGHISLLVLIVLDIVVFFVLTMCCMIFQDRSWPYFSASSHGIGFYSIPFQD